MGIYANTDSYGVLTYTPRSMRPADVEGFLFDYLDPLPFFKAHIAGSADVLFAKPAFSEYPEFPPPSLVKW